MENVQNKLEISQQSLLQAAEILKSKNANLDDLIGAIQSYVFNREKAVSNPYQPADIVESRFMPAEEAFAKGMVTCGSLTNISAMMLRHLGYQVKLIHGECEQGVDHAWISVFVPEKNEWVEYDLSTKDRRTEQGHVAKATVSSWEEIRAQIESDRDTEGARIKERELRQAASGK